MNQDDKTDKEDRRERYNRRHGYIEEIANSAPHRRKPPYKRQQDQGSYLDELDDWLDDNE